MASFFKYQAAGNDFVLFDNRTANKTFSSKQISQLCDRRFGIGADGLILLEKDQRLDFRMIYFNRDGSQSFCGNGCRAIVHFAKKLGVIGNSCSFTAHDGPHGATILEDGSIKISLSDVRSIEKKTDEDYFVNTGTEHNVRFVKNISDYPVVEEGRKIRYSEMYKPGGTNADFVEATNGHVAFRIYERGVEDETFSSGSGATACALVAAKALGIHSPVNLTAPGGKLKVEFKTRQDGTFYDIHFTGPAQLVFQTEFEV